MAELYPEERCWVKVVASRGTLNIPTALRVVARPEKFHELIGEYCDHLEDFLWRGSLVSGSVYGAGWLCTLAAGATIQSNQEDVHPGTDRRCQGMLLFSTVGGGGLAALSMSDLGFLFGAGTRYRVACRLRIPQSASGGEAFVVQFGFHDQWTVGTVDATDGVYFEHSSANANWNLVTRANAVETRSNSGTAVSNSAHAVLEIEVEEDGTLAWFRINGNNVGTHSTNIPQGDNTRTCGLGVRILDTAGGVANRTLRVDWARIRMSGSSQR